MCQLQLLCDVGGVLFALGLALHQHLAVEQDGVGEEQQRVFLFACDEQAAGDDVKSAVVDSLQLGVQFHFRDDFGLQPLVAGKCLKQFVVESHYGVMVHMEADGVVFRRGADDARTDDFFVCTGTRAFRLFRPRPHHDGCDECRTTEENASGQSSCVHGDLVEEIPGQTELEPHRVERIVGGQERHRVAHAFRHVIHHRVDTRMLQVQVGVDVHYRVVSYLDTVVRVLEIELADGRRIVQRVILGEVAHVSTQFHGQYFLCQLELQVQVAVQRQVGQGQDILVAAFLICDFVVPVEDAQCQVMLQRRAQHLDVVAALAHPHVVPVASVVGLRRVVEIGVVRDVFHTDVQRQSGLFRLEFAFDARAHFFRQVVVPPEVARVVVAVIERGVDAFYESLCSELDGVLEQAEVKVGISCHVERAHFVARQGRLSVHPVVERLALLFQQFAADAEDVVRVFAVIAFEGRAERVHHVVGAHLVVHESRQSRLGPLVEALAQGDGKGVFQRGVACDVALVFAAEEVVCPIVRRGLVGDVLSFVVVILEGVDEARHGDEVVVVLRRVLRHFVEPQVVAVGEEDVVVVVAVPRAFQVRGDVRRRVGGRRGDFFRADDVAVVRDTAVFGHLHVVLAEEEVIVILVACIGGEECPVEERRRLVVVHAATVDVVEAEAEVQAPPRVHAEVGHEAVFSVLLVAA